MRNLRAAFVAATTFACAVIALPAQADWNEPWKAQDRAIVIDAYEFNPIDWKELTSDKRIAGFINKASDGLPPEWNCKGKSGDDALLCKNRWWKYSVTKELYMTRREMAKTLGLKWGAYHLGRPGNPREQADHFVDFAEPEADELIALDIEDNTEEWMSLADAEIFANQIKIRTGRYPVLYTNGSTAKWIADYRETYPLLARLPLWYARYRGDITGLFPEDNWPTYALWQFSSMHNCSAKDCHYRVKGAKSDIDVNVASLDVAGLKAAWPFAELVRPMADEAPAASTLVAGLEAKAERAVSVIAAGLGRLTAGRMPAAEPNAAAAPAETIVHRRVPETSLVAAYGPAETHAAIDPLKLLTETALKERRKGEAPGAASTLAARAMPKAIVPGKRVQVAALGSFSGLKDEMRQVAAIAKTPVATLPKAVAAVRTGAAFGVVERSKVRRWLQLAEARNGHAALAMPAYVLSQGARAEAGRGPRLATALKPAVSAFPRSPVERIAGAFHATR